MDVLASMGFGETHIINIEPMDYRSAFSAVQGIIRQETDSDPEVRFHIDISSCTPVAAVAASNASMGTRSEIYYLNDKRIVSMESEALSEISELRAKSRVLSTLLRFQDADRISNKELMGNMSPSRLQYRTKTLHDLGLIEREGSTREPIWVITPKGKQVLSRFRSSGQI
jgi:predicted transcriptional regulator